MREKTSELVKTIFGLDNGVMRAAERGFDLLLLNVLFVLTSLPLVTHGLAKVALYRSLVTLKDQQRIPVLATYWGHLKAHWRQGLVLGLVEGAVFLLALTNLYLTQGQLALAFQGLQVIAYAVLFLNLLIHLYAYPLVGRGNSQLKELYRQSLILVALNLGWSLVLACLVLVLVFLLRLSLLSLLLGLSLLGIFGIASLGYLYMQVMERLVAKFP